MGDFPVGTSFSVVMGIAMLLIVLTALVIAVRGLRTGIPEARRLYRAHQLVNTTGQGATGLVVSSVVETTTTRDGFTRAMAETIRFSAADGTQVTGAPMISDVGMEDRTGQEVPVRYDPEHPARFLAPQDGAATDIREPAQQAGIALLSGVLGLVAAGFVLNMALRTFFG